MVWDNHGSGFPDRGPCPQRVTQCCRRIRGCADRSTRLPWADAQGYRLPRLAPLISTRLFRLTQQIGVDQTSHGLNPSESVDSDSIDTDQSFRGH